MHELTSRRRFLLVGATFALVVAAGAHVRANGAGMQLPDLVPLAPFDVGVRYEDDYDELDPASPRALRFSVTIRNVGAYPLEIQALPRGVDDLTGASRKRPAEQCVGWIDRVCSETKPVGDLVYHEPHEHWHLEEALLYELRRLTDDDLPVWGDDGLVRPATKASFCLMDSAPPGTPSGLYYPDFVTGGSNLYVGCDQTRQGISPGWSDTYYWWIWGQQIPLTGVPPGRYALTVTFDPSDRLYESGEGVDRSYTIVSLP